MNKLELAKYPLSAKVVKDWFMKEMMESFKDETVPSEFKDFMLEQGIEDSKVETLINLNPRTLFDCFDENEIYINITRGDSGNFMVGYSDKIKTYIKNDFSKNRKEAEKVAIEFSFELLEEKLKPINNGE
jgi:hypothetical protein